MKTAGKPIKIKKALEALRYIELGLNEAETARVLKTTRQQVNRWVKYAKMGKIDGSENNVDKE